MTEERDFCGECKQWDYGPFNIGNIFILKLLWPGMGVCNLISHSIHGISRLENVSGKKKI